MSVESPPYAPPREWTRGLGGARSWTPMATLLWGSVAVGIVLRLGRYAVDRSLWIDEAFLALNVVHRSFGELLKPLDYFQGAPTGFLLAERAAVRALGSGEYALRLVPLLAGVASVPLFVALGRLAHDRVAQLVATACFALSTTLVYYSAQVKPYTLDVLLAILLLLLAWPCLTPQAGVRRLVVLAAVGTVAPWLSFASAVMLVSIWLVLAGTRLARRCRRELAAFALVGLAWAASGVAEYLLTLHHLRAERISPTLPNSGFVPSSPVDGSWYANSLVGLFREMLGVPKVLAGTAVLVFLVGCAVLWRRNRAGLALLVVPVAVALVAAVAHLYGFGSRFSLFLAPSLFLVMGVGVSSLVRLDRARETLVGVLALGLIVGGIAVLAAKDALRSSNEEIKPVLGYLARHRQPGDTIFVDYWAQYAYAYYARRYGLPVGPIGPGPASRRASGAEAAVGYPAALRSMPPRLLIGPNQGSFQHGLRGVPLVRRYSRVWLVFAHARSDAKLDEEALYRVTLSRTGHLVRTAQAHNAGLYLWRP